MTQKRWSPLEGIPIRTPTEIEELREKVELYKEEKKEAPKAGEYDIPQSCGRLRGQKVGRQCGVCKGEIEHVFHVVSVENPLMGTQHGAWRLKCSRCSNCGLQYELAGLE